MEPSPYRDQSAELTAAQNERNAARTKLLASEAKIADLEDKLSEKAKSGRRIGDGATLLLGAIWLCTCVAMTLLAIAHSKTGVALRWAAGATFVVLVYRRIFGRRWLW